MLICKKTRYYLDSINYLDIAITEQSIRQHLEICLNCQTHLKEMRTLKELLRNQKKVAAPNDFEAKLGAQIRLTKNKQKHFWFSWMPTPTLTAVALITIATVIYSTNISWQSLKNGNNETKVTPILSVASGIKATQSLLKEAAISKQKNSYTEEAQAIAPKSTYVTVKPQQRFSKSKIEETALNDSFTLMLRDENDTEHMIEVPTVLYGAQPIINTTSPKLGDETSSDTQHIF